MAHYQVSDAPRAAEDALNLDAATMTDEKGHRRSMLGCKAEVERKGVEDRSEPVGAQIKKAASFRDGVGRLVWGVYLKRPDHWLPLGISRE
ncbi:hypothetical protein DL770_003925 [Monosporascus sp. CRB-9-2]|nr:hypothetical protein DL770_003925 [Monosporascus sp. CRB-9-2]